MAQAQDEAQWCSSSVSLFWYLKVKWECDANQPSSPPRPLWIAGHPQHEWVESESYHRLYCSNCMLEAASTGLRRFILITDRLENKYRSRKLWWNQCYWMIIFHSSPCGGWWPWCHVVRKLRLIYKHLLEACPQCHSRVTQATAEKASYNLKVWLNIYPLSRGFDERSNFWIS